MYLVILYLHSYYVLFISAVSNDEPEETTGKLFYIAI